MRFQVEREALAEATGWAARALPARPASPILAGLLVEAGGALRLSGFDYEASTRAEIDADVAEPGRVLVPGRLLAEVVRSLPGATVRVEADGGRVRVGGGSTRFTLQCLPVGDYPGLPEMPVAAGAVDGSEFVRAVGAVAVAAGRDDALPLLTGMLLDVDGDELTLVSTDRYRIAIRSLCWRRAGSSPARFDALVPARAMTQMARSAGGGAAVSLAFGDSGGVIGFECGDRQMTTRLLAGDFIPWRSHVPAGFTSTSAVARLPFIAAIRRVALVAEPKAPVRVAFRRGEVVLEAASGEEAQAVTAMPAEHEGEELALAFNPQFLLDGLAALESDVAVLHSRGPLKPVLLTGSADLAAEGYRYVVMPIRAAR